MISQKIIGNLGEAIARKYLQTRGYEIIASQLRNKHLEIDILAKISKKYVYVEVKTRTKDPFDFGLVLSNIKQKTIGHAIMANVSQKRILNYRFDLLLLILNLNKKSVKIRHWQNLSIPDCE